MHVVYVIYSESHDQYYVGLTQDISHRAKEHNKGRVRSTKPYVPWELIHLEEFETLFEARKREKYLKSAAGRRWRKINIRPRSSTG
ncbi:MAG: GIY-YIG nuclease family protein [Flavobacteriaceae bacterium]